MSQLELADEIIAELQSDGVGNDLVAEQLADILACCGIWLVPAEGRGEAASN